jgi:hypothetical protein
VRSILEYNLNTPPTSDADALTAVSLAEYGWTIPDIPADRDLLVQLANEVIETARTSHRDLPVSPESQFIQDVIDKRFGLVPSRRSGQRARPMAEAATVDSAPTAVPFARFTFERNCLEQALLILTQIPENERNDAFQRSMKIVVSPEYKVYGIIFGAVGTSASYQVRLRCSDVEKLQTATTTFVSAMNPTKQRGSIHRYSSPSASVGRQGKGHLPFISSFTRAEIRSVTNEELFEGEVLPITGRLSLARHSFEARGAGGALAVISAFLVLASAALFALFPDQGWWNWCDQLLGRLATGAFGALLVDGAIDYSALRRSLLSGAGRVTNGAIIKWTRVG